MTRAETDPPAGKDSRLTESSTGAGVFESSPFKQILDTVPFGLFVLDAAGVPVFSNSRADEILHKRSSPDATPDTLAESYSAYLAGTDTLYPADRMPIVRALAGEMSTVDDMEIHRGDEVTYLEVTGAPVFDTNNRVKYAVAVFNDITATRAVEAALRLLVDELETRASERTELFESAKQMLPLPHGATDQNVDDSAQPIEPCYKCGLPTELERSRESAALAKDALRLFIANFSHELRTPLNHIIGFSDLIESKIQRGVTKGVDKHAEIIRESGSSLLDTLNKIITVAEGESSDAELSLQTVDVESTLREITTKYAPLAERNGNRFELVVANELGFLQTDLGRIRTALEQLVENACKHCSNGSVSVTASRKIDEAADLIEVVVSDTGPGIDPKRAERLVEGEVVAGDPLHDAGLGLGIPLAVQVLGAIGGSMTLATEPGGGTRWVIAFPDCGSASVTS